MNEEQFRSLAEAVMKAAGNGCPRCFASQSSQPTRVQELVSQLDREGVTTFAEIDAIQAKRDSEAKAAADAKAKADAAAVPAPKTDAPAPAAQ